MAARIFSIIFVALICSGCIRDRLETKTFSPTPEGARAAVSWLNDLSPRQIKDGKGSVDSITVFRKDGARFNTPYGVSGEVAVSYMRLHNSELNVQIGAEQICGFYKTLYSGSDEPQWVCVNYDIIKYIAADKWRVGLGFSYTIPI